MATGTRARDWATVDFYAVLGIARDASDDEVARAFRLLAKQLHPDAGRHEPGAGEQFKEVAAAYAVLSDPRTRVDYDRVRAGVVPAPAAGAVGGAARGVSAVPSVRRPWSRRRSWTVLTAGIALTVLGLVGAGATWWLHDRDADERSRFVPVQASRVQVDGRSYVAFTTADGERVIASEPRNHGDPVERGRAVAVRYDPEEPEHVILDASTFGRDITLAIVAFKLLVGGVVFGVLGLRRLRRAG
jgi:curved DNA-binding protein CbpA